jgi:hypothetical protein
VGGPSPRGKAPGFGYVAGSASRSQRIRSSLGGERAPTSRGRQPAAAAAAAAPTPTPTRSPLATQAARLSTTWLLPGAAVGSAVHTGRAVYLIEPKELALSAQPTAQCSVKHMRTARGQIFKAHGAGTCFVAVSAIWMPSSSG